MKVRGLVVNHYGYSYPRSGEPRERVVRVVRVVRVTQRESIDDIAAVINWPIVLMPWIQDSEWSLYTGVVEYKGVTLEVTGVAQEGSVPLIWARSVDSGRAKSIAARQWIGPRDECSTAYNANKYDLKMLEE